HRLHSLRHPFPTRRSSDLNLGAWLQDQNAVAKLDGLIDVVGDYDDGLAKLRLDIDQFVLQTRTSNRVYCTERLIHEHDWWVSCETTRNTNTLLLTTRKLTGEAIPVDGRVKTYHFQKLIRALRDFCLGPFQKRGNQSDIIRYGDVGEKSATLNDVPNLAAQFGGIAFDGIVAVDKNLP